MIITKDSLIRVKTCEKSLIHFIEVLGKGDSNFSIEYRDALKYLLELKKENPTEYSGWPGFLISVKDQL